MNKNDSKLLFVIKPEFAPSWDYQGLIACSCHQSSGLGIRSLVFSENSLFFESERAICSFKRVYRSCCSFRKERIAFTALFVKSDESELLPLLILNYQHEWFFYKEQWIAIPSFVLDIKRVKACWKEQFWIKSLLHKERIAPVTLYLKTTFSTVAF